MDQNQNNNPYDFITNTPKQHRSIMPSPNSTQSRVILVGGLFLGLIIAGMVFSSLLNKSKNSSKERLLSIISSQTELIRLSSPGVNRPKNQQTRNFMATMQLATSSDQQVLAKVIAKNGIKEPLKSAPKISNKTIDDKLDIAAKNNRFDEEYKAQLATQLGDYRSKLKTAFAAASGKAEKEALNTAFNNASLLSTF
jgi:hypothetical protein